MKTKYSRLLGILVVHESQINPKKNNRTIKTHMINVHYGKNTQNLFYYYFNFMYTINIIIIELVMIRRHPSMPYGFVHILVNIIHFL